ncbi:MAG: endonuclease III domain-containing protein [Deltaproteobacteria bacterium]|nr:endonuclease III domain-containing protein [Deltaproteobacteria bacterium]
MNTVSDRLNEIYELLVKAYGPQHWWPAESPLEVMVGAVLTQNTNWQGVEQAIANLKRDNLLNQHKLKALSTEELSRLIKPAGYFNLKARRLKNLIEMVTEAYGGDLAAMEQMETAQLRQELLLVNGVGPETADSILLYAFHRPIFVVDTYTYRVTSRHGLIEEEANYQALQDLFMEHLPLDVDMFNEYHALLVRAGKLHCKRKARCEGCPLEPLLP